MSLPRPTKSRPLTQNEKSYTRSKTDMHLYQTGNNNELFKSSREEEIVPITHITIEPNLAEPQEIPEMPIKVPTSHRPPVIRNLPSGNNYKEVLNDLQNQMRIPPMIQIPNKITRLNTEVGRPLENKTWSKEELTNTYQKGKIYTNKIRVSGELNNIFIPEGPPLRQTIIPIGSDENYFRN